MRNVAIAAAAVLALAAPAAAEGASYFNGATSDGASVKTSGRTIQHLELYCSGRNTETVYGNKFAFSLRDVVSVRRKGRFSYSGKAFRYGNERQPLGEVSVKVSGRVTSTAVRAKWSLPNCGSGTVTAPRQRG
jgi:hypothetical protein